MPRMGVHARQGFYIQPHPATGHLGRVDITNHITSPGQGLQRGVTLFFASFVPTSACKFTYKCSASAAKTRAVNDDVSPSFTVQSYEIEDPIYSEFDMLQREK